MLLHSELGPTSFQTSRKLKQLIDKGLIRFAGNRNLKIYGTLECGSGKRMKPENRVFFANQKEATESGYRPCGHCMKEAYRKWKNGSG